MAGYVVVFLVLVGVWCSAGYLIAAHPLVAPVLSRWGHVLLPAALLGVGALILASGHAFGL